MKEKITAALIALSITTTPTISNAQIPVTDSAQLAEFIQQLGVDTASLTELVQTYQKVREEYELLLTQYEEWRAIADIADVESLFKFGLEELLADAGIDEPITAKLEEPAIISADIFGSDFPRARESFDRRQVFIHDNIKKINNLQKAIVARESILEATAAPATGKETEKDLLAYQGALLVQNALNANDALVMQLLKIQLLLGDKALDLEEVGKQLLETRTVDQVGQ